MNERIKELLAQCTQESIDGSFANRYVDQEKFAELIVRECAKVVEKEMDYDANWCDDKILKHFGVEE